MGHKDFCVWLANQLEAVRSRNHEQIDWDELAEEIEGLLARYRGEIKQWAQKIIRVLMRQDFRYGDWNRLRFCHSMLKSAIEDSPSLIEEEAEALGEAYQGAKLQCSLDDLDVSDWPEGCPWPTVAALLETVEMRCAEFARREREGFFK
jgi:hypothetical protein